MATHTQTHDNVEMLCLPVYSDVTFLFFFFRSCRGAKSHDCNKAKGISDAMELFLYVSRTPLVWTGAAFFFFSLHSGAI